MLGDNQKRALWNHIKALETLQEAKDEAAADYNERKALAKADGFDTNVIAALLKRRKNGEGQTVAFDDLLRDYEDAMVEQKDLPFSEDDSNQLTDALRTLRDGGVRITVHGTEKGKLN